MYHYTMSARLKCDSEEAAVAAASQGGKTTRKVYDKNALAVSFSSSYLIKYFSLLFFILSSSKKQ